MLVMELPLFTPVAPLLPLTLPVLSRLLLLFQAGAGACDCGAGAVPDAAEAPPPAQRLRRLVYVFSVGRGEVAHTVPDMPRGGGRGAKLRLLLPVCSTPRPLRDVGCGGLPEGV